MSLGPLTTITNFCTLHTFLSKIKPSNASRIMPRRRSPLDPEENCRSCTSFADYAKAAKKGQKAHEDSPGEMSPSRSDCPLDKDELGRGSWGLLHTIASKYPAKPSRTEQRDIGQFIHLFAKFYPCDSCAEDFRKELQVDPPKTESYREFSQWLCRIHNRVNVKLGKEQFDCSKIDERWRDGWKDGSCDF